uniref:Taste receptor type 2 n=1 Tax=Canis lupus dingo TaxID=286419 RepID=A0A8C0QWA0_CANLU
MLSTMEVIYIFLIAGEMTIGIWGNGFIALVNCTRWLRRRDISVIDIILVILAISRICLLCVVSLDGFILLLSPDIYANSELMNIVDVVWTLSNHSSICFTSCLSIFYLLKIANISHPFFLWLKLKINRVILGMFLMSFLTCIIISVSLNEDFWDPFKVNHKENITWESKVSKIPSAFKLFILNLGAIVPFVLCLISVLLLLFSLFRHTRQMKLYATGSRDPSTEAHMRAGAMKTVTSFLFLLFVYYGASLLVTFSYLMKESKLAVMFEEIIATLYPSGHSLILVIGNNKLRQAFIRMLRYGRTVCMM